MKPLLVILLLCCCYCMNAQRAVPPLWGHAVHDEAHVLGQQTIDQLEAKLKAHEDSTTNQIAVLVIPSLEGASLEEYALHVAHDVWKLGQKGKDNGVLLLVAIDDRKMRIEVGYGLEGALPDAITSRIIRNEIAPAFRTQNYEQGIVNGVEAIISAIGGEFTADSAGTEPTDLTWQERLMIGIFIFAILSVFTFLGLFIPGCGGWFLYAFLIPFYATFPMIVLGENGGVAALGTYFFGFPIAKAFINRTSWGKRLTKKFGNGNSGGGWSSGSGWTGGGGFSSGGGGWSSGGGGFSGGGGSFGGGGSSGSW